MTINDYLEYIDYFNSRQYDRYYTDDIVVQLPTTQLRGRQNVKDFYLKMGEFIHETVRVRKAFIDGDTIGANIWSDFYCVQDTSDYLERTMTKGEMFRAELFVLYTMEGPKFSHIRAARFRAP